MTIVSLSVSHRAAPIEVLDRLAVPSAELAGVLAWLHASPSIEEVLVLATCNRVEVYAAASGPVEPAIRVAADLLAARGLIPVAELRRLAQVRIGGAAVEHLFSVACGLDSMAVGEEQIVAQLKGAARAATAAATTGPALTGLIDAALRVSKRARTETSISTEGISLARAGLELADTQLGGLAGRRAMVVGTGSMGRLAARLLRAAEVGPLSIAGRDPARTAAAAAAVQGRPVRIADVATALAEIDVLICATGAAEPVVRAEQVQAAREAAGGRALFVLDLGLPPDVDPAVRRLAGITLADLSALGRHLAEREAPEQVPQVRAMVAAASLAYQRQQEQAAAGPVIAALHAQIRRLADDELDRLHHRLPGLDEEQQAEIDLAVHRILRKVLHQPTVRARDFSTDPNGSVHLEALRQLFDLGPRAAGPESDPGDHPTEASLATA